MVLFNYSTKELTAKVVYYGPGLCGKTTNLQWIHEKLPIKNKGKMLSLATETDRTLFFDFLPIELGTIRGMKTRIQLYTVPGQVFYNATRRMVLKGADCVVFVCDSQEPMIDANLDSLENLRENLEINEIDANEIPLVLQYNKRDLPNAASVELLNERLNPRGVPHYEAVALKGIGVEETLKGVTGLVFRSLATKYGGTEAGKASAPPAPKPAAPPPRVVAPPPPPPPPEPEPEPEAALASADELLDSLEVDSAPPPEAMEELPLAMEEGAELSLEDAPPNPEAGVDELTSLPPVEELALEDTPTRPRFEAPEMPSEEVLPPEPEPAEMSLEAFQEEPAEELSLESEPEPPPPPPPSRAPAPTARAAAPAPKPSRPEGGSIPVSVEVSASLGQTDIDIPVEVTLGDGTTQVNLHLRLTLNLKLPQ